MIEVAVRKFYKTADGLDIVPKASFPRMLTSEEVVKLEAAFDKLAAQLEAVEMTLEQRTLYVEDETADEDAAETEDNYVVRA